MRYRELTSPITFGITQNIVGVDGAPLPPLDNVTAWLAISISRKLRTAYTGSAIRLRRDSDNAELNIGFNPQGGLDTDAVTAWLGAANGFIVTLYDQSGNNRNYTQTVAANQPAFVLSSALGGKPAASFNGTSHSIPDASVPQDVTQRNWMGLAAIKPAVTTGGTDVVFSSRPFSAEDWAFCSLTNVNNLGYAQGAGMSAYYPAAAAALPGTLNAQQVAWVMQAPNAGRIRRNGVDVATGLTSSTRRFAANTIFGQEQSGGAYYNGELAEFVLLEGSEKFAAAATLAYEANSQAYHITPLWTPAALGSSLALWLDAADASTITLNGSTVSQWNDKSGNGRHASQATAANQPTYSASAINGKTALTFDGSDDFLNAALTATNFSVGIVGTLTVNTDLIYYALGFGNPPLGSAGLSVGGTFHTQKAALNEATGLTTNETVILNSPYLITAHAQTGNRLISFNGQTPATDTNSQSISEVRIGMRSDNVWPYAGRIGEVVITNTALSTTDRQKLEGYLAWKWGLEANLPVAHPFRNSRPTV